MVPSCLVVLVRPKTASNLGAVARVMRNMGLEQLVLVQPQALPSDPRALLLATHSAEILDQAVLVADLGEALAECGLAAATTCRLGGLFRDQAVGAPEEILPKLQATVTATRPAALVFGPEDHGLTNDEIARCHYLIRIPTAAEHLSLNLAQAVAICLYEWRRCWLRRTEVPAPETPLAPFAEQEFMFDRLREALEKIHFLYGPKADSLMHALRHLLGRACLTPMEIKLLLGLARQISWTQDHAGKPSP